MAASRCSINVSCFNFSARNASISCSGRVNSCDPGEVGWRQEPPLLGEWAQGPSPGSQEGLSRVRTKLAGRSAWLSHGSTGAVCKVRDEKWGGRCCGMPKSHSRTRRMRRGQGLRLGGKRTGCPETFPFTLPGLGVPTCKMGVLILCPLLMV